MSEKTVLMMAQKDRVERAALNAWPGLRQLSYDGWLLRFAEGYTKRANSVNILREGSYPLVGKIKDCEVIYKALGLTPLFRLPEMYATPELLESFAKVGYEAFDPTLVLCKPLSVTSEPTSGVEFRYISVQDWLQLRSDLTGTPLSDWKIHAKILSAIRQEKVFLGLLFRNRFIACGMAVAQENLMGYFSIFTAPAFRQQGFGRWVMTGLGQWGLAKRVALGYLQVEGDNVPALRLYKSLEFCLCYTYHYYRKPVDFVP